MKRRVVRVGLLLVAEPVPKSPMTTPKFAFAAIHFSKISLHFLVFHSNNQMCTSPVTPKVNSVTSLSLENRVSK